MTTSGRAAASCRPDWTARATGRPSNVYSAPRVAHPIATVRILRGITGPPRRQAAPSRIHSTNVLDQHQIGVRALETRVQKPPAVRADCKAGSIRPRDGLFHQANLGDLSRFKAKELHGPGRV